MCWLAHLATLDGVEHEEVAALASAGNFGQVPGNCARDVTRRFCSASRVPEPLQVAIPVLDPKTNKDSTEDAGIMLPHMVFSTIATGYPAIFESLPSQQGTTGSRMYLPSTAGTGRGRSSRSSYTGTVWSTSPGTPLWCGHSEVSSVCFPIV